MQARRIFFYLILFIPTVVVAQQNTDELIFHSQLEEELLSAYVVEKSSTFDLQLISDATIDEQTIAQHSDLVKKWVDEFKSKQAKSKHEKQFLEQLFYKVHRKVLKNYTPFTSLNTTLTNGNYDCLSGTTLYAILFNGLGVDFDIIETNYHIYLRVFLSDEKVILIESTDPINGFIDNPVEIKERLAKYVGDNSRSQEMKDEYIYKANLHNNLGLESLPGLHYYNEAVEAFNATNIEDAVALLQKAELFYNSERINEFGYVLAQTLLNDGDMPMESKRAYLSRISVVKDSGELVSLN